MAPADWLAPPSTTTRAGHHVLRHPDAAVARDPHGRVLVHPGAVVADVPVDLDLELAVQTGGERVGALRVVDPPVRCGPAVASVVQPLVELPHGRGREVDRLESGRRGAHATFARSQEYTRPGSGSHWRGVLGAGEHRDRPVLGGHRDPVVGLGHHRRLAGDRVAQHGEAVGRADGEGVEAVEVVEAAAPALSPGRRPPRAARSGSRPRPPCRCRSGTRSPARAGRRAAGCGWRGSRCGRGRGRGPVENGWECSVVTRLSVAIRVCPSAWVAETSSRPKRSTKSRGSTASL